MGSLPIRAGKWTYSARFQQADIVIGKMGKPMSWFDDLGTEDRTYIVAYWQTRDMMTGWEQQKAEEEMKRAQHGT